MKDGRVLDHHAGLPLDGSGPLPGVLELPSVTGADSGVYSCHRGNNGSVYNSTLTVIGKCEFLIIQRVSFEFLITEGF